MKNVDDVGKHTWASEIKSYYIDLDTFILVNQCVGDVEHNLALYKQRLVNIARPE